MALLSRKSAGYEIDKFVYEVDGEIVKRYYGNRYTNQQARFLLLKEIKEGKLKLKS